jgi:hypothetical protein
MPCQSSWTPTPSLNPCKYFNHLPSPPFTYKPQYWTGTFYKHTTLQTLGLVSQLGHDGEKCPSPGTIQFNFMVLDISGLHLLDIRYCECHHLAGGSCNRVQLLRSEWFSSTVICPQSAFTFDVLNTFHLMTLQGKISAYDFTIPSHARQIILV